MNWGVTLQLASLLPILLLVGFIFLKKWQLDRDQRRDPLNTELRQLPGQSLQARIDNALERYMDSSVYVLFAGFIGAITIASRRVDMQAKPWDSLDTSLLVGAIGCALFFAFRLGKLMPTIRHCRQGLRAEIATAQELAASVAGSNRLINDIQCGEFNIDHVVITAAGVFAVETKSRRKPALQKGVAKAFYDSKTVSFPDGKNEDFIPQAERQARWLADYLQKSTGRAYPVTPVLALPGWWVDPPPPGNNYRVRVINPKKSTWLFLPKGQTLLSDEQIQAAAFQIEKLAQVSED